MPTPSPFEPNIRCLRCGYPLHSLPVTVCPECGREFDPADAATYDHRPPDWRRKRAIRRGVALVVALLVGFAVFRQGRILDGKIAFQCVKCGAQQTAYRWEVQAPKWVGMRFPGMRWRTGVRHPPSETRPDCGSHFFGNLWVRFEFPAGQANATLSCLPTEFAVVSGIAGNGGTVNGNVTTPDNAVDVLRNLMGPDNFGVSVARADQS